MSVKVSQGVFGGDVYVPSWDDFQDHLNAFHKENENKEALWRAINELKLNPGEDIYSELRSLRDKAFTAYKQLNGPLPKGEWTVWKCIEVAGKRLDALEQRLKELPDALRKTVREAVCAELKTLIESAITNLDSILKDNGELKDKTSSLSDEVKHWRDRVESAEKQFQAVPDKIAELQRLLNDAKANLNYAKVENNHLREEVAVLREDLASCRKDIDELRNPPKKKGFFQRLFFRSK